MLCACTFSSLFSLLFSLSSLLSLLGSKLGTESVLGLALAEAVPLPVGRGVVEAGLALADELRTVGPIADAEALGEFGIRGPASEGARGAGHG